MLSQYNPIDLERILRDIPFAPPFPPAAERAAWEQLASRLGDEAVGRFLQKAEAAAEAPIPALSASLWLECKRTGERRGYEAPMGKRREMLRDLALGECLERQGRFLDPLMDVMWAILEESSWVYPAHHVDLADRRRPYVDLGAAMTAFDLAEVNALLGAELPPEVSWRVRDEVDERVLAPYLARHDFWWLYSRRDRPVNNWTAVCNAGVMAAAIYLEADPARLAKILAKGLRSLDDYLATFDPDGGSTEGPGYWTYGFGYYTLIAALVEQRTGGNVRPLDGEQMHKIGAFPLRTMLSPGMYVNFSDAPRFATFSRPMLAYLGRRLDLPGLIDLAKTQPEGEDGDLNWLLRALFWDTPGPGDASLTAAPHDWYSGMMWMIARYNPADPNALALAAKGGHNAEMHNHNDVGAFIVHLGQESLIADIGCGRYTLQYFSDARYDFLTTSSLGHSVPVVNGHLQSAGQQFQAQLIEHSAGEDCDALRLELKNAYPPEAGLESLQRRLALHRDAPAGWVELEDTFAFQQGPAPFESALTTFSEVTLGEGAVLLKGSRSELRVGYDEASVSARVEYYHDVEFSDGTMDVHRVVFEMIEPAKAGAIRLEIVPV